MSKGLGSLTLDLIVKTGNWVGGLSQAEYAAAKWQKKMVYHLRIVGAAFGALINGAAAATVAMVKSYSASIDAASKSAKQVEASYSSFVTLKQAAADAGVEMSTLMSASRTLNRELGKAVAGNEKAAKAFERIGLSASELAKIPLDERIGKINDALDKNVHASQRAAAASEIFGSKNGQAMAHVNPDVIKDAAEALDVFGLRLSDVDAAKIEQANQAMGTFQLITQGIGTQLTVKVAPALKAIGDAFFATAKEAGGLGDAVSRGVDKAVYALSLFATLADGVKRVFTVMADAVIMTLAQISQKAAFTVRATMTALDKIPGINYSKHIKSLKDFEREAYSVAKSAAENMAKTLGDDTGGKKLLDRYKLAQAEGRLAAEIAVKEAEARRAQGAVYSSVADSVAKLTKEQKAGRDAVAETIEQLQFQVATLGMSARQTALYKAELQGAVPVQKALIDVLYQEVEEHDAAQKAADNYKNLVKDLRTEEEKRTDTLRDQLGVIQASGASQEEQAAMALKAAQNAMGDIKAPSFGGGDSMFGEFFRIREAEEELSAWYDSQLSQLNSFKSQYTDQMEYWHEVEAQILEERNRRQEVIDRARETTMLGTVEAMFGQAASLAKQYAGESSAVYKALFAVEKAAAIARSIVAINAAMADAAWSLPFPGNLGAMATVASATAGIVSSIMAVGMAHDGIDKVPQTGTWLLQKGERVMTSQTSAKLDRTLTDVQKNNTSGNDRNIVINLNEDASKAGKVERKKDKDTDYINIWISDLLADGKAALALERKYSLATVGR